jgi:hypothetical protein
MPCFHWWVHKTVSLNALIRDSCSARGSKCIDSSLTETLLLNEFGLAVDPTGSSRLPQLDVRSQHEADMELADLLRQLYAKADEIITVFPVSSFVLTMPASSDANNRR